MRARSGLLGGGMLLGLLLGACSSPAEPSRDPASPAPLDFSVDMTVRSRSSGDGGAPVHRRSGHFVLMADGTLHADSGPTVGPGVRPAPVRMLRREQVAEVWTLAETLGLTVPENGSPPVNDTLLEPGEDEILTVATFTGDGDRWQFVWRNDREEAVDLVPRTMLRELAALAWISDRARSTKKIPVRYDFGPDPYAQYRVDDEDQNGDGAAPRRNE